VVVFVGCSHPCLFAVDDDLVDINIVCVLLRRRSLPLLSCCCGDIFVFFSPAVC
jgi:hypothetical protein